MNRNSTIKFYFLLALIGFSNQLFSQSTDLLIQKTGSSSVYFGQMMSYTITVSNSGTSVNDAIFNDNFPIGVNNVTLVSCTASGGAICPLSSDYLLSNTNFSGIIPLLPHGASVEFILSMKAPLNTFGLTSISNTATVSVPAGFVELDSTTNSSTWNTTLLDEIDISNTLESSNQNNLGDCSNLPFTTNCTVQWVNMGPSADINTKLLNSISLNNLQQLTNFTADTYLQYSITNLLWTSNNPNTNINGGTFPISNGAVNLINGPFFGITSLNTTTVTEFQVGDTITLTYTFTLDSAFYLNCGTGASYDLSNNSSFVIGNPDLIETNSSNNSDFASNLMGICDIAPQCPITDIGTTIELSDTSAIGDCIDYPFIQNYTVKWFNNGSLPDTNTILKNEIKFINVVTTPLGGANYLYPYNITNVQWSTNSASVTVPTTSFVSLSDTMSIPQTLSPFPKLDSVTIPYFYVGDTFTLTYTFTIDSPMTNSCGHGYDYNLMSQSSYEFGSEVLIDTISGNNSESVVNLNGTCHLTDGCDEVDLSSFVSISTSQLVDECLYPLEFDFYARWVNHGPSLADSVLLKNLIFFSNVTSQGSGNTLLDFPYEFNNVSWNSSNDSTTPVPNTSLELVTGITQMPSISAITELENTVIPIFGTGDTLELSYSLKLYKPTLSGCGNTISFDIGGGALFTMYNSLDEPNISNNTSFDFTNTNTIDAVDLAISESVNPAIVSHLDTTEITILFQNASNASVDSASWSQFLPTKLEIIQSTISCNTITGTTICGPINYNATTREISQTVAVMEANSMIEIKFKGIANSVNSTTVNLEANALIRCFDCIPATNFTQTTFQINGLCELAYAGEISSDPSNCNASDGFAVINTFGPYIGNLNYEWYDSTGMLLAGQNNDTAFNLQAGEYTVIVLDDSVIGCQIEETIILDCVELYGPYAENDSSTTLEDTPVTIIVLINDIDSNGTIDSSSVDLDPYTSGIQDSIVTIEGLWVVDSLGNVQFFPAENYVGNASIDYTILDNDTILSNVATIFVEIESVNDPPFINDDIDTANFQETIVINVLSNDSDSTDEQGQLDTSTLGISVNPNFGTIVIDSLTGEITYIPDSNFVGTDSFQYIICDNGNPILCDSAWVYIIVLDDTLNSIVAVNDSVELNQGGSVDISILENDSSYNSIIDSASLSVSILPENGVVEVLENGQINYTPNELFFGLDSFQYVICNNGNPILCDSAWVYINVLEIEEDNDGVFIMPDAFTPNNDNLNELFRPYITKNFIDLKFRIYNRWGQLIYSEEHENTILGWDGKYLNREQAIENYLWFLSYTYKEKQFKTSGTFSLIR